MGRRKTTADVIAKGCPKHFLKLMWLLECRLVFFFLFVFLLFNVQGKLKVLRSPYTVRLHHLICVNSGVCAWQQKRKRNRSWFHPSVHSRSRGPVILTDSESVDFRIHGLQACWFGSTLDPLNTCSGHARKVFWGQGDRSTDLGPHASVGSGGFSEGWGGLRMPDKAWKRRFRVPPTTRSCFIFYFCPKWHGPSSPQKILWTQLEHSSSRCKSAGVNTCGFPYPQGFWDWHSHI